MQKHRKSRRLSCEQLENRSLLAGDMQVAFRLETLNSMGAPVNQVQIGESFVLRASVERLPAAKPELLLTNTFDLTFDSDLVKSKKPLDTDDRPWRLAGNGKTSLPPLAGAFQVLTDHGWKTATDYELTHDDAQWEIEMTAVAGGEVVFATNPGSLYMGQFESKYDPFTVVINGQMLGETYYSLDVDPNLVQHAMLRLQVGDPTEFAPSLWRNPKVPSDVNDDGKVSKADIQLLKEKLGSLNAINLVHASMGTMTVPYLDVNGDRWLDSKDIDLVQQQFAYRPKPVNWGNWPDKPKFLSNKDDTAGMVVTNIRTGKVGGGDALVGDLLKISVLEDRTDPNSVYESVKRLFPKLKRNDGFAPVITDAENFVVRLTSTGTVKFELAMSDEGEIRGMADWWDEEQENVTNSLFKFGKEASISITVGENSNRPVARDLTIPIFENAISARDVAVPSEPLYDKKIIAEIDILANYPAGTRAMLVDGLAYVNEKGLFDYYIYSFVNFDSNLKTRGLRDTFIKVQQGGSVTYVIMNDQGTSELHTVTVTPKVLPLMDLSIRAVDEQGKEVTKAAVGDTLYVEVTTYSNRLSENVEELNPLSFSYDINSQVASRVGEPDSLATVTQEIVTGLKFEDGKYQSISRIVTHTPQFQQQNDRVFVGFDRFDLSKNVDTEKVLFRQKLVVTNAGPLNLSLSDVKLVVSSVGETIVFDTGSVHVRTSRVEITKTGLKTASGESEGAVTANRMTTPSASNELILDVDGNGQVTALDVLKLLNYINKSESNSLTSTSNSTLDVDKDGLVTAVDVLKVINYINAKSGTAASVQGEGEDKSQVKENSETSSVSLPPFGQAPDIDDLNPNDRRARRRR